MMKIISAEDSIRKYIDMDNNANFPDQNSTDFQSEINRMFADYKISERNDPDFCRRSKESVELRSYQKFIGEYFGRSQYRGLLLIHGTGSGKTLTAVQVMNIVQRQ